MRLILGLIWGFCVAWLGIFINHNYDAITALAQTDGIVRVLFFATLGVVSLSLLAMSVMLLSGLVQLLVGRNMPTRWMVLFGFVVGIALASWTFQFEPVVL